MFTTTRGTPLIHSSFQTHFWKQAKAKVGVNCRFHDLRHTSVALAIADAFDEGWAAARAAAGVA